MPILGSFWTTQDYPPVVTSLLFSGFYVCKYLFCELFSKKLMAADPALTWDDALHLLTTEIPQTADSVDDKEAVAFFESKLLMSCSTAQIRIQRPETRDHAQAGVVLLSVLGA